MSKYILNELAEDFHALAVYQGWYDIKQTEDEFIERMCNNLHDEISELHEAWRNGLLHSPCDKAKKMEELELPILSCLEEEIADMFIRLFDDSCYLGIDLERAIKGKHSYNISRPRRHGGKKS
jgi:NTP pyrophosphatase (non-canonical NTP hydrolase)